MSPQRKVRLAQQKKERKKFHLALSRAKKAAYTLERLKRRTVQDGNLVGFYFNPDELGVSVFAPLQSIEKLGLERAWERLNREDFFQYGFTRIQGNPTKEVLAAARAKVLSQLQAKLNSPRVDLSTLTTAQENNNETNPE